MRHARRRESVEKVRSKLAHDGAFLRQLAYVGARHGPNFWLRWSPPLFGVAFALALGKKRRKVRDTLRWVRGNASFGREQREIFATFIHYAQCLAESLAAGRKEATLASCRVTGESIIRDALARGRGVLVLTAHAGPWDAAARGLRQAFDRDVVVVMQQERDSRARGLHDEVRRGAGVQVVHVGEDPLDSMPLLRQLKQGGVVAIQLDRAPPNGRVLPVTLFDRTIGVPEGPFRLAALAGTPLIPLFARRQGHFEYDLMVYPSIDVPRDADRERLISAAQTATDAMGRFIAECPTQWFNF